MAHSSSYLHSEYVHAKGCEEGDRQRWNEGFRYAIGTKNEDIDTVFTLLLQPLLGPLQSNKKICNVQQAPFP